MKSGVQEQMCTASFLEVTKECFLKGTKPINKKSAFGSGVMTQPWFPGLPAHVRTSPVPRGHKDSPYVITAHFPGAHIRSKHGWRGLEDNCPSGTLSKARPVTCPHTDGKGRLCKLLFITRGFKIHTQLLHKQETRSSRRPDHGLSLSGEGQACAGLTGGPGAIPHALKKLEERTGSRGKQSSLHVRT